jgi:hypothetical protein
MRRRTHRAHIPSTAPATPRALLTPAEPDADEEGRGGEATIPEAFMVMAYGHVLKQEDKML